jgi:hypothetical protein
VRGVHSRRYESFIAHLKFHSIFSIVYVSYQSASKFNNQTLQKLITAWIVRRQRPFLIVEDPEFIEILRYVNPKVSLVKADAVKNSIMDLYEKGRQALRV